MATPDKAQVKTGQDLLYQIFIQHLTSREADLNENPEDFALAVAHEYLREISGSSDVLAEKTQEILEDLQFEVTEMLRKKIYGHFNLRSYRQVTISNANKKLNQ